jgi:hypothetical protein
MSIVDFKRFNGFAKRRLDDRILTDLLHGDIFNESDMHSAAYYYIRDYFRKKGRGNIYVRCEPQLGGMKPDIVVYEGVNPVYAFEFKMFKKPDCINENAIEADLMKLASVVEQFPSFRWGFFQMIYDCDLPYSYSDARLRRAGFERVSVTTINARRKEGTNRRRVGYDRWREGFDRLGVGHQKHA